MKAVPLLSMGSFNGRPVVQRVRVSGLTYPEKGDDFVFQGAGIDAEVVVESSDQARQPTLKVGDGARAVVTKSSR